MAKSKLFTMKIPFNNNTNVDTKNLSDKEADISKAIKHLFDTCQRYNVTAFLRIILNQKKFVGMTTVVDGPTAQKASDFDFLLRTINDFVQKTTDDQVALVKIEKET